MEATKPSLFFVFVQQGENSLDELTGLEEIYVLTTFGQKFQRKLHSESKLSSTPTVVHLA